jgi:hypothetical protein
MDKKAWYIFTMEKYSAMKNEIMSFPGKWIELESIMLSKSKTEKEIHIPSPLSYNLGIKKENSMSIKEEKGESLGVASTRKGDGQWGG